MILLFFICLFSIGSTRVPLVYDHVENDVVDRVNEPKKAFTNANYDFYSSQELISLENLINYVDWVYRADGVNLYEINSQYQRGFSVSGSAFFVESSENISMSNIENDTFRFMTIQTLRFTASVQTGGANQNKQRFMLDFVSTTSNTRFLRLIYYRVYNAQLGGLYTWYTTGLYYYVNSEIEYYASDLMLVYKNPQSQDNAWARQFFNYYGLGTDSTVDRYSTGYQHGWSGGYNSGYNKGYNDGYDTGYDTAIGDSNPTMNSIFAGIFQVGLLPVNVFLTMFNYEIFGINISGFVSGLLTISVIIIILRFLFGGGSKDGK